jgi:hypothetical protein
MRKWIALAAVLAFAGCAKKQPVTDTSLSPTVTLEVVNNMTPPAQITAFIQPAYGGKTPLGTVSPGRTGKFTYTPTNATDRFVFIAQFTSGRMINSQAFTMVNLETASWDIQANIVRFYER